MCVEREKDRKCVFREKERERETERVCGSEIERVRRKIECQCIERQRVFVCIEIERGCVCVGREKERQRERERRKRTSNS